MPVVLYSLLLLTLFGCASSNAHRAASVSDYRPSNVFRIRLPQGFTRVAVLPMVADPNLGKPASLANIESVIRRELLSTKRFELLMVSRDELESLTGKETLSSTENWPYLLKKQFLEQQVDGVMVVELTALKGTSPVAIGLKARLVGLQTGETYWAADEIFDAGKAAVFSAARTYEKGTLPGINKDEDSSISQSPSKFAAFAALSLFKTLP